jgi:hypothetical protein
MLIFTLLAAAALGPTDGKTMAQDDWQSMSILEVGGTAAGGPHYVRVAAGDLDGDGRADEAYVKLVCADGAVQQAFYTVRSPRDSASGMASGKRQHKPVTFVKEWGPATLQLRTMKTTYDVKKNEGARMADGGGWTKMTLGKSDGLCAAAEAAAATIVKSKSNITNN